MNKMIGAFIGIVLSSSLIGLAYNNQSIINTKNSAISDISKLKSDIKNLNLEKEKLNNEKEKLSQEKEILSKSVATLNVTVDGINSVIQKENLNVAMLRAQQTDLTLKIENSKTTLKVTDAQVKMLENVIDKMKSENLVKITSEKINETDKKFNIESNKEVITPMEKKDNEIKEQTKIPESTNNLVKVDRISGNDRVVLSEKNQVSNGKVIEKNQEMFSSKVVKSIY
jgi:chromosome segregation ATPase